MAVFQTLFDIQADVLVHRAVMTCNEISEERSKLLHNGLRHFSRVCKNQGCGVGADRVGDGFDVVFENFEDRQIAEFRVRDENVQIQFP